MNKYDAQIRDAAMHGIKTEMMGELSAAMVQRGGTGLLRDEVIEFLESCARNGIRVTFCGNFEGPYGVGRDDRGQRTYTS